MRLTDDTKPMCSDGVYLYLYSYLYVVSQMTRSPCTPEPWRAARCAWIRISSPSSRRCSRWLHPVHPVDPSRAGAGGTSAWSSRTMQAHPSSSRPPPRRMPSRAQCVSGPGPSSIWSSGGAARAPTRATSWSTSARACTARIRRCASGPHMVHRPRRAPTIRCAADLVHATVCGPGVRRR